MPAENRKNGPKTPRILIVDDDSGQRSLLDSFLRGQGFETVPVSSGERALEVLRSEPVSMMISDVRMPGQSGLELLKQSSETLKGLTDGELPEKARRLVDQAVSTARESADTWIEFAQSSLGSVRGSHLWPQVPSSRTAPPSSCHACVNA